MGELKVYYNSACPVCNAGIRGQKQRMNGCPVDIQWIDIHSQPEALTEIGAQQEFVRKRLHLVDEKGALAQLTGLPLLNLLSNWAYNAFAALLYAWNRANRRW